MKGKPYVPIVSSYVLDSQLVNTYTAPNLTGDEADGLMFFNSGQLPVNTHSLTVTVQSASLDYPFLFDYLIFTPAPTLSSDALPLTTTSSSTSSSSTSLVGSGLSFTSSSSSTSASQQPTGVAGASHSSSKLGPILGGVFGGIGLVAIAAVLLWWCLRQQKARPRRDDVVIEGKSALYSLVLIRPDGGPAVR